MQEIELPASEVAALVAAVSRRTNIINALPDAERSPSTALCIEEAGECIALWMEGGFDNYLQAADRWAVKAGQHQFGFALPEGW